MVHYRVRSTHQDWRALENTRHFHSLSRSLRHGAKAAIYPFKRIFQTAMVDEDILSGFSTISYTPGQETDEPDGWYINMATLPQGFLEAHQMEIVGH